jgi:hypothetical protein
MQPDLRSFQFKCRNVNPVYLNEINRSNLEVYTSTVNANGDPKKAAKIASGYRGRATVTKDDGAYVIRVQGREIARVIVEELPQ